MSQLDFFNAGTVPQAKGSPFEAEDYSPMEDMTLQPATCEECGEKFRRSGAFLFCRSGHSRMIETLGREDHPLNPKWEAYIERGGRDSFEAAVARVIKGRRFRYA